MNAYRCSARILMVVLALSAVSASACRPNAKKSVPSASPNAPAREAMMLTLSSPAFEAGGLIPVEYANTAVAGGQNVSIPYEWGSVPEGTKSLALVIVDRHPVAHHWVHWMVTAIPGDSFIPAAEGIGYAMPAGSVEHPNTSGGIGYGGPQPPKGSGNHEYEATLYALDVASTDPRAGTLAEFNASIDGHVLGAVSYSGLFGR